MKKMLFFAIALATLSFMSAPTTLTKKERKSAVQLLKSTEKELFRTLKGLTDAQLKYKPAPDRWSIEECVIHIATTEEMLWQMTDAALKQPANPEKRADIKVSDEEIVKMVENRTEKRKTFDNLKPENSKYKTLDAALEALKASRNSLERYLRSTDDDLRNHVLTLPFGQIDSYQMILFMAGHTNRHTQQIQEVMADAGYPK